MTKESIKKSLWNKEVRELGIETALLDRLRFHGGLSLETMCKNTGMSKPTIRKHMSHLVKCGMAIISNENSDIWRPTPKSELNVNFEVSSGTIRRMKEFGI